MALTTTPSELTATALTLTTAAQPNITSVGTLTTLTVDNLGINGNTITANSGALNLTPASGSAIVLDGTINVDAGVVTGATSITSTAFVGGLTGNVTGNASGTALTVTQAAQSAITSVGTLTGLQVDGGVTVNGAHINIDSGMSFQWDNSHERIEQSDGKIEFFTNNGEQMTLSGSNLGIGNTSPDRTVSIKHASQAEIGFKTGSVSNGALIYYNDSEDKLLIRAQESGDHIAFQTGGTTERMRIDSSGNVGINSSATRIYTASFGSSDNVKHLTVKSASGSVLELVGSSNSHQVGMGAIQFVNDANDNNTANAGGKELALIMVQTETSDTNTSSDSGGALRIFTKPEAGTTAERMRIDSAGNVGINHTSPEHHLHVTEPGSTNEDGIVKIGGSNSGLGLELKYDQAGHTVTEIVANPTYTNTQSIMRLCVDRDANANTIVLTGAGNVGVGTDAPGSSRLYVYQDIDAVFTAYFCNDHAGAYGVGVRSDSDSMMYFYNGGTFRGRIYHNGSTMLYADQSDYRLKENVQPMAGSITRLKTLKPVTFDWKADKKSSEGFLAHEVQPVVPSAVSGEKDAKITEHGDGIQIMDYGKLTPVLVGALQEALAKIETLETKVAALEAK